MCAIVGGVFTVTRMFDGLVHKTSQIIFKQNINKLAWAFILVLTLLELLIISRQFAQSLFLSTRILHISFNESFWITRTTKIFWSYSQLSSSNLVSFWVSCSFATHSIAAFTVNFVLLIRAPTIKCLSTKYLSKFLSTDPKLIQLVLPLSTIQLWLSAAKWTPTCTSLVIGPSSIPTNSVFVHSYP